MITDVGVWQLFTTSFCDHRLKAVVHNIILRSSPYGSCSQNHFEIIAL
jgi:hypothetical protein